MPVRTRRAAAAIAVGIASASILAATTARGASTVKALPQRITLFSASVRGKEAPIVVQAAGPIRGLGTETQTEKNTAKGQINYATLHFANGTVQFLAQERFVWKPDFRSCSATAAGGGTFTITGGTGAYRGVSGKGTFTSNGVMIGARDAHGKCLTKAQPTINYVIVRLVGTSATGS